MSISVVLGGCNAIQRIFHFVWRNSETHKISFSSILLYSATIPFKTSASSALLVLEVSIFGVKVQFSQLLFAMLHLHIWSESSVK